MVFIFLGKFFFWGGGKRRIDLLSLFINVNEAMEWVLVKSVGKDVHDGGRRQWESYGDGKIKD